jgi:hypothetical protein
MQQQIHAEYEVPEEEVSPSAHCSSSWFCWIPFIIPLARLQQEDGPKPKNDDGSNFRFLPVAPIVLFGKNAPPPSKGIMRIQPSTAKLTPKWKRYSDAVAPRAHTKVRKMLVRKIRKDTGPSSTSQEAPTAGQVWITFLIIDPLRIYILLWLHSPFLQSVVVDISSGKEPTCKKGSAAEAPEDFLAPVSALVTVMP